MRRSCSSTRTASRAAAAREDARSGTCTRRRLPGATSIIDQKHRSALEMRGILDQIVAHPQGIDPATFAEIQRYTKLFWINNGPYNNLTARKFVLKTTPEAFAGGGQVRASRGRDLRDAER